MEVKIASKYLITCSCFSVNTIFIPKDLIFQAIKNIKVLALIVVGLNVSTVYIISNIASIPSSTVNVNLKCLVLKNATSLDTFITDDFFKPIQKWT